MKIILISLVAVFFSISQVLADDKLTCSLLHAFIYKGQVRKLENDKQMHCSMSCLIARKCEKTEVVAIGFIKEFVDALGFGTPDSDDISANLQGIKYADRALTESKCYSYCKLTYPK
jgi:hypothetical protein